MGKIVDSMRIYRGGITGVQPMADIVYMSNGDRQKPITIQWDVVEERNEVLKYLNGYTLIKDERVL